jgi:hypothetical protein
MSRGRILYERDREMMLEFSGLCVKRLNSHLPLRFFLSVLQHFIDANVHKEIAKNRLVIEHAAAGFEMGKERTNIDADGLFEMTKKIDHEFLNKLATPLFSIQIRHDDFADIRKKRIVSLINMVYDLLCNWQAELPFDSIVQRTFAEKRYMEVIGEVLHLYNIETRMLSHSITLHGPAGKVKDLFAEKLFETMEKTAGDIAAAYTRKVYVAPVTAVDRFSCRQI